MYKYCTCVYGIVLYSLRVHTHLPAILMTRSGFEKMEGLEQKSANDTCELMNASEREKEGERYGGRKRGRERGRGR